MAELKPLKVLSLFDEISCGMIALERAGSQKEYETIQKNVKKTQKP